MIPVPYPFQLDLFNRVRATRQRGARIIVVQGATGCGKNTFGCYMTSQAVAKGSYVLSMVHRRKLVDQISERLHDFEVQHGIIMRGEDKASEFRVQVASRDTLMSRCVKNGWLGLPPADLVIVDEAHHAWDPQSDYRRILENYPKATIILLTATPVDPEGKGLGPWAQAIECAAPTSQLVRDGYLVPVKCYAPDRKLHNGKAKRGIAGELVDSWKRYAEGRPTVLFCSRVQHSLDAVEAFKAAGIPAAHVDADTKDEDREAAFAGIASGKVKVVANVGVIGEGVDLPELGCCQLYFDCQGRVRFLQAVGRIMRPSPGKEYGILIDHAGAVFRHGFPDEDTEWTLEGNADEAFQKKHDDGQTAQVHYCARCERIYHGQLACPQCGKQPTKPPRSIFAPPPVDARNELLTEVDRNESGQNVYSQEEKIKHWMRCLGVAANKNGSFGMAAQVYKQKYHEWPGDGFPHVPARWAWKDKVADSLPQFIKRKKV